MIEFTALHIRYLIWHYVSGTGMAVRFWKEIFWFIEYFFSLRLLLRSLFSPWRALSEEKRFGGMDLSEYFSVVFVNIMMRIVGVVVRLFVIVAGFLSLAGASLLAAFSIILWIFLPVLLVALPILGAKFIVT